jgi:hypothetical protein
LTGAVPTAYNRTGAINTFLMTSSKLAQPICVMWLHLYNTILSGSCDIVTLNQSLAMAQAVNRPPLSALMIHYVGFVVDKVALEQVFFQVIIMSL